jgi:hypothetical protein
MRHQHWNGHVPEEFTADAPNQGFAQLRMVIGTTDDQVRGKICGARE